MSEDSAPEEEARHDDAPAEAVDESEDEAGQGRAAEDEDEDEDEHEPPPPGRSKIYWIIIAITGLIGALIPIVNKLLPDPVCVKGETQACATPLGPGVQRCQDDGKGWHDCTALQACKAGWFERCETAEGESGNRGCAEDGRWGPCEVVAAQVCSYGDMEPCETADGVPGVKLCLDDGSGWEACKPMPVCSAGDTRSCKVDGAPGRQTCKGDGSGWGACKSAQTHLCSAGETRSCTTAKGAMGTQRCAADRKSWAACEPKQICTPGQKASCKCAAGVAGWRTCNADGTGYGSCQCASTKPWCEPRTLGMKVVSCTAHGGAVCMLEDNKCVLMSKPMLDAARRTKIEGLRPLEPIPLERGG